MRNGLNAEKERATLDTVIEWDTPWQPGLWFLPPELVSLHGTPLWQRMTTEQQHELARREAGCHAWALLRVESVLIQMLARHVAARDPAGTAARFALTEIEDECRHARMFARLLAKLDVREHDRADGLLWRLLPGPIRAFTAALIVGEVLDRFQRATVADEAVQPTIRAVCQVHVIEQARHIGFARGELRRRMLSCGPSKRFVTQLVCGPIALLAANRLVPPHVYAGLGLDEREARRQARANAHRHAVLRDAADRVTGFFAEVGVIGPINGWAWTRSRFR